MTINIPYIPRGLRIIIYVVIIFTLVSIGISRAHATGPYNTASSENENSSSNEGSGGYAHTESLGSSSSSSRFENYIHPFFGRMIVLECTTERGGPHVTHVSYPEVKDGIFTGKIHRTETVCNNLKSNVYRLKIYGYKDPPAVGTHGMLKFLVQIYTGKELEPE